MSVERESKDIIHNIFSFFFVFFFLLPFCFHFANLIRRNRCRYNRASPVYGWYEHSKCRAWNCDAPSDASRKSAQTPLRVSRLTREEKKKNTLCHERDPRQVGVCVDKWSQIQARFSTREPLDSTKTRLSRVERAAQFHATDRVVSRCQVQLAYVTSNYHFARVARRTSKQCRRWALSQSECRNWTIRILVAAGVCPGMSEASQRPEQVRNLITRAAYT